jgi:hypothetical protein
MLLPAAPALAQAPEPGSAPASSQPIASGTGGSELDVDILFNYYEQDGENSPVTGGIGTEEMDVISPVILLRWKQSERWTYQAQLGIDNISSASTDNIDLGEAEVSSASRLDNRAYSTLTATRTMEQQDVGVTFGFSKEYDYSSFMGGLSWSRNFRQQNTTLSAGLRHYSDTIDLYGIDGIERGQDDRSTTDFNFGWTEVLGPKTLGSLELSVSSQDGFLSTPFHEVILAPTPQFPDGQRVAERLPDSRLRTALALRLSHAVSKRFVPRFYYRLYDDDWGVQSHTAEVELWFRLPTEREQWIYPIARYYTQDAADYFGLPRTFDSGTEFLTADRDLSEFTSDKYGLGWRWNLGGASGRGRLRYFETRLTTYSRDDGLDSTSLSFGIGFRFNP